MRYDKSWRLAMELREMCDVLAYNAQVAHWLETARAGYIEGVYRAATVLRDTRTTAVDRDRLLRKMQEVLAAFEDESRL